MTARKEISSIIIELKFHELGKQHKKILIVLRSINSILYDEYLPNDYKFKVVQ